ncbi:MAG: formylmethanofuran--tetrahydromethanopterin formyltransferase, partial [Candidatus Bathyarchaeota archaeon]
MKTEVEDTYAEAFEGLYVRVLITSEDNEVLYKAARDATATPSIVIGRIEGGVERWLDSNETPDGRSGAILQFWKSIDNKKPLQNSLEVFETELSYRIRQDILVKPFTALFDAQLNPMGKLDMMEKVGHC